MAVTFLKKGADAHAQIEQANKEQEEAAKQQNVFRYRLTPGESGKITFLDGDLNSDGMLDIITYFEHTVKRNEKFVNYPCVSDTEPCPLCMLDNKKTLVGVFSVIDHRSYTSKNGTVYKDTVKLFVCKRPTLELLEKAAVKRGGLTGWTVEAIRGNEKTSAAVGGMFDFETQMTLDEIKAKYEIDGPLNYEEVIPYYTADELRELGYGTQTIGADHSAANVEAAAEGSFKGEL